MKLNKNLVITYHDHLIEHIKIEFNKFELFYYRRFK